MPIITNRPDAGSRFVVGRFTFWGRSFWRWCGVAYGTLLAAGFLLVTVLDVMGHERIPDVVGQLIYSLFLLIWAERMQAEARRVQTGWIGKTSTLWSTQKSRSGTHEQFAKSCRRGLGVAGWAMVCLGGFLLLLSATTWLLFIGAWALHNKFHAAQLLDESMGVFFGLAYLSWGAVAINCRRILSMPRSSAPPSTQLQDFTGGLADSANATSSAVGPPRVAKSK